MEEKFGMKMTNKFSIFDGSKIILRIAVFTASLIVISVLFLSNNDVMLYDTSKNTFFNEKTRPLMISSFKNSKVSNKGYCNSSESLNIYVAFS